MWAHVSGCNKISINIEKVFHVSCVPGASVHWQGNSMTVSSQTWYVRCIRFERFVGPLVGTSNWDSLIERVHHLLRPLECPSDAASFLTVHVLCACGNVVKDTRRAVPHLTNPFVFSLLYTGILVCIVRHTGPHRGTMLPRWKVFVLFVTIGLLVVPCK